MRRIVYGAQERRQVLDRMHVGVRNPAGALYATAPEPRAVQLLRDRLVVRRLHAREALTERQCRRWRAMVAAAALFGPR
jgi:hypothetical protein